MENSLCAVCATPFGADGASSTIPGLQSTHRRSGIVWQKAAWVCGEGDEIPKPTFSSGPGQAPSPQTKGRLVALSTVLNT